MNTDRKNVEAVLPVDIVRVIERFNSLLGGG